MEHFEQEGFVKEDGLENHYLKSLGPRLTARLFYEPELCIMSLNIIRIGEREVQENRLEVAGPEETVSILRLLRPLRPLGNTP